MRNPKRKIAFVLATSDHGTMIVNRLDYRMIDEQRGFGVGFQILAGAENSLTRSRSALIVESIKSDKARLRAVLERLGHQLFELGLNLLAIHAADQTLTHIKAP
jgi:hypothetical protein